MRQHIAHLATFFASVLLTTAMADDRNYGIVVYPESPVTVQLSNRDINRLVCQSGSMEDIKYSTEKGIIVEGAGSDFFVKFQMIEVGEQRTFVQARSEFFVRCGGKMYTLFGEPKNIKAQTIFLGGETKGEEENVAVFNPMSDEERVISITHSILKDETPASFSSVSLDEPYKSGLIPGVDIRRRTHFHVEGTGLSAAEFLIRASRRVRLQEAEFMRRAFGNSIYAITLETPELGAGDVTRAVIVYRGVSR
ncbi:MAG: type-F conjugative transfer system secretin TraK [Pseudomonadota bacterium]